MESWPRSARIALAALFILLGVTGIVVPILPGWPFFLAGLVILTTVSRPLKRAWHRYLRHHPKLRQTLRRRKEARPS